jgi:hypothetical protein
VGRLEHTDTLHSISTGLLCSGGDAAMGAKYWSSKEELREWINLLAQERRERKIKAGLCSGCLKRPKLPEYCLCQQCLDRQKARRHARYAKGLCHCGKPHREDSKYCENHYTKMKDRHKARLAAGICRRCNEPRYKESVYCRVHLTLTRKDTRQRDGLQPWYPGCGGTVPMDSDEPDFELTNGDELFNG